MAVINDSTIKVVTQYIEELEKHQIHITEAILFGSCAKGRETSESDIDVALVSDDFTGDRFEDRRRIVPLRREIDSRIEPILLNRRILMMVVCWQKRSKGPASKC